MSGKALARLANGFRHAGAIFGVNSGGYRMTRDMDRWVRILPGLIAIALGVTRSGGRREAGAGLGRGDAAFLRADRQARRAGGGQRLRLADGPAAGFAVLQRPVLPAASSAVRLRRAAEPARPAVARLRRRHRSFGLIVTNFHVIENADEVKVALSDRREFDRRDRSQGRALRSRRPAGSRAMPARCPSIEFADSDKVEVGDLVLAIGDPFGVGQTVTSGIVSAFARMPSGAGAGPVLHPDRCGDQSGQFRRRAGRHERPPHRHQPADRLALRRVQRHRLRHPVEPRPGRRRSGAHRRPPARPWLGASLQNVTADIAEGLGIDRAARRRWSPRRHGERAGARRRASKTGDLITSIDGDRHRRSRLAQLSPGDQADRRQRHGDLPSQGQGLCPDQRSRSRRRRRRCRARYSTLGDGSPFAGATVVNLSPAVADELGYDERSERRHRSADVADGSTAATRRLPARRRVVAVNGVDIDTTKRLLSVTGEQSGRWLVKIRRDGQTIERQFRG